MTGLAHRPIQAGSFRASMTSLWRTPYRVGAIDLVTEGALVRCWRLTHARHGLRSIRRGAQPDRVLEFSFTAGGGRYAGLFDGNEKVLSWDNIVWLQRDVILP